MNAEIQRIDVPVAPFIEGALTESASESLVDVIDPSTGLLCLSIPAGSTADVDRAVASARRAFEDGRWSHSPPSVKKRTLHRLADLIAANGATLDALDAGEMGKPIGEAFGNAAAAAGLVRFYAEAVDKVTGDVYSSDHHSLVMQRWVPRGVVAAVVPWNFPAYAAALKFAPALAAGNSVVLKPSELSSRSAMRLAELATQAGIPPGVLNVVPGLGGTVGEALGLHMDVDMLTFTGSTEVGKKMLQYSGQSNMKAVMAECGGKSPQVVFGDGVDLNAAADSIARAILTNQGQVCSVGSRVLVQRASEEALVDRIAARFEKIVMGNALDSRTTFGPLASSSQCSRVMRYVESAQQEGVELVKGGRRALVESGGCFVEPTMFRSRSADVRVLQEEIFGPVLSVISFEDEAEAVRIANGTIYGLAATVWTSDLSRGMRMAKSIRSPVRINGGAPKGEGAGYAAASEPVRQSGVGVEFGLAGMESYLHRHRVWFSHE